MAKRILPSIQNDIDPSKYLGLVAWVAQMHHAKNPIFDSWQFSCGCIGLMAAKDRFDPSRNVKFETYAVPWIRHYILTEFRKKPLFQFASEFEFGVDLTDPTDSVFKKDDYEQVETIMEKYLKPKQIRIMQLHYFQHLTFREIGEMLNVSRQRVEQLHQDALFILRRKCAYSVVN